MSKKKAINFDLSEIADGGVQVKLNRALQQVADNILDPNTDPTKKWKVQLNITVAPNEKRDASDVTVEVKTTLAPEVGVPTTMLLGRDINGELTQFEQLVIDANGNQLITGLNGRQYLLDHDGDAALLNDPIIAHPLQLNQLTSLIEWLESETQEIYDSIKIHVVSPTKVEVVGELNGHGQRPCFAEVRAVVDRLNLENYLDQEKMIIMLQSHFEENDDRNIILKVVSNLRDESIHQQTDDGVSQSVQINSGVASVDEVKVPNPVKLIPFRTFQEVDQPASKFIFRMREGMQSALFMADNNQWQVEAKNNIKKYIQQLEQETFGEIKYPVIA